jgi:hypothetical protein
MERHPHAADLARLAPRQRLYRRVAAEAVTEQTRALCRREIGAAAGAGVIAVGVRHDRARDGLPGVHVEAAAWATTARPAGLGRVLAAGLLLLAGAGGWWELSRHDSPPSRLRYPRCQTTTYATEVQDCWREFGRSVFRVRDAHAAHRALIAEIEISHLEDAGFLARDLVAALTTPLDEVMFYFRTAGTNLRVRVRWTRARGFEQMAY